MENINIIGRKKHREHYLVDFICFRGVAGGETTRQLVYDCYYYLGDPASVTTCCWKFSRVVIFKSLCVLINIFNLLVFDMTKQCICHDYLADIWSCSGHTAAHGRPHKPPLLPASPYLTRQAPPPASWGPRAAPKRHEGPVRSDTL